MLIYCLYVWIIASGIIFENFKSYFLGGGGGGRGEVGAKGGGVAQSIVDPSVNRHVVFLLHRQPLEPSVRFMPLRATVLLLRTTIVLIQETVHWQYSL